MNKIALGAALVLALTASTATAADPVPTDRTAGRDTVAADKTGRDVPADNTGRNERDQSGATRTPGDQSNSEPDMRITQTLRKNIVADKDLSTNAHNVKIITVDGTVTLRGPVASAEEKARIDREARAVAGVKKVDNQLEIAAN
jgi:hyperosmotically inducible protein